MITLPLSNLKERKKDFSSEFNQTSSQVVSRNATITTIPSDISSNSTPKLTFDQKVEYLKELRKKAKKEKKKRRKKREYEQSLQMEHTKELKKKIDKQMPCDLSCPSNSVSSKNCVSISGSSDASHVRKTKSVVVNGKWPRSKDSLPSIKNDLKELIETQNMEFAINEECTSLDISPSASCIIGGFTDGTIRFFDLMDPSNLSKILKQGSHARESGYEDDEEELEMDFLNAQDFKSGSGAKHAIVCSRENQQYGAVAAQIHAKGVHTALIMHVSIAPDCKYAFGGVMRGSTEMVAIDITKLETSCKNGQSSVDILDSIQIFKESDAKLKGFGACTRWESGYRLFCGRGIKNIHIWNFIPPSKQNATPIWSCICDTQSNGNTVNFLRFRYLESGTLQAISKSDDQKLRLWDLSSSANRPPYRDVQATEDSIGCCGAYAFGGGYNQMNVVHLEAEDKLCSRMEIQLPGESGTGGRRRGRGALKKVVNAVGIYSGSHALIELSDGTILHFDKNQTAAPLQQLPTKLYQPWPMDQGTPLQRKLTLSRIGSEGLLVFALSLYNITSNRGKILLRMIKDKRTSSDDNEFWGFSDNVVASSHDETVTNLSSSSNQFINHAPMSSVKIPPDIPMDGPTFLSWSSPLSHRSVVNSSPDHPGQKKKVVSPESSCITRTIPQAVTKPGDTTSIEKMSPLKPVKFDNGKNMGVLKESEQGIKKKERKATLVSDGEKLKKENDQNKPLPEDDQKQKRKKQKYHKSNLTTDKEFSSAVNAPSKSVRISNNEFAGKNFTISMKPPTKDEQIEKLQGHRQSGADGRDCSSKMNTHEKNLAQNQSLIKKKKAKRPYSPLKEKQNMKSSSQPFLQAQEPGLKRTNSQKKKIREEKNMPQPQPKVTQSFPKRSESPNKKRTTEPRIGSNYRKEDARVQIGIPNKVAKRTHSPEKKIIQKAKINTMKPPNSTIHDTATKESNVPKMNIKRNHTVPSSVDTSVRDQLASALCDFRRNAETIDRNAANIINTTLDAHLIKYGQLPSTTVSERTGIHSESQPKTVLFTSPPSLPSNIPPIVHLEPPNGMNTVTIQHENERRELALQHLAAHERLRSKFLAALKKEKEFYKNGARGGQNILTDLEEIICDHEDMLEETIGVQELEASVLFSKQRAELGRRVGIPRLEVSFPFPHMFAEARKNLGLGS